MTIWEIALNKLLQSIAEKHFSVIQKSRRFKRPCQLTKTKIVYFRKINRFFNLYWVYLWNWAVQEGIWVYILPIEIVWRRSSRLSGLERVRIQQVRYTLKVNVVRDRMMGLYEHEELINNRPYTQMAWTAEERWRRGRSYGGFRKTMS